MRPRSRTLTMRAMLTGAVVATALLTSCASDGLRVADSYDNTVPASADVSAAPSPDVSAAEGDDTVAVDDTAAPTFTFPKPTIADSPATAPGTAPVTAPAVTAGPAATGAPATTDAAVEEHTYVEVFDDTGLISASIPTTWTDIDPTSRVGADGASAPSFEAAPDLDAYRQRWDTPGMRFTASAQLAGTDPDTLIDELRPPDCDTDGSEPYDDGAFTGRIEVFSDCGGIGTSLYVIGATSNDGAAGVIVTVQAVTDADRAAFDEIQRTFNIHS